MRKVKDKYTKIDLLLFLYNIPVTDISTKFNKDRRKYIPIIDGSYQRIEKDTVSDLCRFLNISVDAALDGITKDGACCVYIANKDMWIYFDEYILLRSTEVVVDYYDQEKGEVLHNFNYEVVNQKLIEEEGISYLIRVAKERPLTNSSLLRLLRRYNYTTDNKITYYKLIKPYLLHFLTEEEIEEKAKGSNYKELVKEANKEEK